MKITRIICMIVAIVLSLQSCVKEIGTVLPVPNSSLTVVNAIAGASPLIATFTLDSSVSTFFNTTPQIGYQSWSEYGIVSGKLPVVLYQTSDTSHMLFTGNFNFQPQGIYSLFLSGTFNAQNQPDTLLVQDNLPGHSTTDSSVGIRFINLSPNSGPVSVDIMGNPPGSEVSSLAYRGAMAFKSYPVTSNVPDPSLGYVFEFRSVGSDSLLTTYTYSYGSIARFKNVTIAFSGMSGANSSYPASVFLVNNY